MICIARSRGCAALRHWLSCMLHILQNVREPVRIVRQLAVMEGSVRRRVAPACRRLCMCAVAFAGNMTLMWWCVREAWMAKQRLRRHWISFDDLVQKASDHTPLIQPPRSSER
eukprot:6202985-Pleurochrysis_carterae.AAC.3